MEVLGFSPESLTDDGSLLHRPGTGRCESDSAVRRSTKGSAQQSGAPHGAPFFLGGCAANSRKGQTCESGEAGREPPAG
jgi:hypothetical protein